METFLQALYRAADTVSVEANLMAESQSYDPSHHTRMPTPHNPDNRPRGWRKARAVKRQAMRDAAIL